MTTVRVAAVLALAWSAAILIVFSIRYAAPVVLIGARLGYGRLRATRSAA